MWKNQTIPHLLLSPRKEESINNSQNIGLQEWISKEDSHESSIKSYSSKTHQQIDYNFVPTWPEATITKIYRKLPCALHSHYHYAWHFGNPQTCFLTFEYNKSTSLSFQVRDTWNFLPAFFAIKVLKIIIIWHRFLKGYEGNWFMTTSRSYIWFPSSFSFEDGFYNNSVVDTKGPPHHCSAEKPVNDGHENEHPLQSCIHVWMTLKGGVTWKDNTTFFSITHLKSGTGAFDFS